MCIFNKHVQFLWDRLLEHAKWGKDYSGLRDLVQGFNFAEDLIALARALEEERAKKNGAHLLFKDYYFKSNDKAKYEANVSPLRKMSIDFFRKHVVVVIGCWNQFRASKGHIYSASPKQIVEAFKERGVKVFKINEYNTSKLCHKHIHECEENPDPNAWKKYFVDNNRTIANYEEKLIQLRRQLKDLRRRLAHHETQGNNNKTHLVINKMTDVQ